MSNRTSSSLFALLGLACFLGACTEPPTYSGEGQHCTSKYSSPSENYGTDGSGAQFVCNPAANRGIECVTTRNGTVVRDGATLSLPTYICRKPCDPAKPDTQCEYPGDICCTGRDLAESSTPTHDCVPPNQCDLQPIPTVVKPGDLPSAADLSTEERER